MKKPKTTSLKVIIGNHEYTLGKRWIEYHSVNGPENVLRVDVAKALIRVGEGFVKNTEGSDFEVDYDYNQRSDMHISCRIFSPKDIRKMRRILKDDICEVREKQKIINKLKRELAKYER